MWAQYLPNNSVEGTKTIYAIVIFQNLDLLSLDKKKTAKTRQIDSIVEFVENKLIIPSPFILIIGNYSSFTNYIYSSDSILSFLWEKERKLIKTNFSSNQSNSESFSYPRYFRTRIILLTLIILIILKQKDFQGQ